MLVRVEATSICHTDVKVTVDHQPVLLPVVPGHQGAGIVKKVDEGVS